MNFTFKKVLPEDVFVTILPLENHLPYGSAEGELAECTNKLSGVEFMDILARIMWYYPYANVNFCASKMQVSLKDLTRVVFTFSGLSFLGMARPLSEFGSV